jgi:hypothetical protein
MASPKSVGTESATYQHIAELYQQMPLPDARLRSLKGSSKTQKLADGGGLHVVVTPGGARLWRLGIWEPEPVHPDGDVGPASSPTLTLSR